jgi:hypothetical protein
MMQQLFLGVDVSRDWLDLFHPVTGHSRVANRVPAARRLARTAQREGLWVIFEGEARAATGPRRGRTAAMTASCGTGLKRPTCRSRA